MGPAPKWTARSRRFPLNLEASTHLTDCSSTPEKSVGSGGKRRSALTMPTAATTTSSLAAHDTPTDLNTVRASQEPIPCSLRPTAYARF